MARPTNKGELTSLDIKRPRPVRLMRWVGQKRMRKPFGLLLVLMYMNRIGAGEEDGPADFLPHGGCAPALVAVISLAGACKKTVDR
jgi:hypothetical protein